MSSATIAEAIKAQTYSFDHSLPYVLDLVRREPTGYRNGSTAPSGPSRVWGPFPRKPDNAVVLHQVRCPQGMSGPVQILRRCNDNQPVDMHLPGDQVLIPNGPNPHCDIDTFGK